MKHNTNKVFGMLSFSSKNEIKAQNCLKREFVIDNQFNRDCFASLMTYRQTLIETSLRGGTTKQSVIRNSSCKFKQAFILLIAFIAIPFSALAQEKVYLNNWQFYQAGSSQKYKADVPGTVHTDLLANKLIPDPFFGTNEKAVQWIDSADWVYETTFYLTKKQLESNEMALVFDGLDTYADIYINGEKEITVNNMFRSWRIPLRYVKEESPEPEGGEQPIRKYSQPTVHEGVNKVEIHFHSALKEIGKEKPDDYFILEEEPRAFARKAQYQFGWDWGPKFTTMGIWKPVYLHISNDELHLEDIFLRQKNLRNDTAILEFSFVASIPAGRKSCVILVKEKNSKDFLRRIELTPDRVYSTALIEVIFPNPTLWCPNGMGKPHLYDFVVELYSDGKKTDSVEKRIGFKSVELKREKDAKGERFYFLVNGKEVFMKGANWVPAESFLPRLKKDDYQKLVKIAAESNFNMLRVWGGGIYEDEAFYDACDEQGILVWQDFAFACALYPYNTDFKSNVKQEATQAIERISQHTSLALWCGNNEIDEGWHNWGWKTQFGADTNAAWDNYVTLFRELLPDLVKRYNPTISYLSSSPVFGWGKKESMTHGDSHYWGVWWGMEPFDVYKQKVPRFMSEYGFQGFPPMSSLEKFIPKDELYLGSPSLKTHQKHPKGYETIQTYMEREDNTPSDLESYAYTSQLLQAYGMKTAMQAHRRAKPYCMGSLYWQFNDCWPVVSWAGVDYYKNWKALQYFVKKSFAQTILSIDEQVDTTEIWLITDSLAPVTGNLNISLQDFSGKTLFAKDTAITIEANTSKRIWAFKTSDKVKDTAQTFCYVQFSNDKVFTEEVHTFTLPKNLKLGNANIRITAGKSGKIILTTDTFVKNICILYDGSQSGFSDNFFDMIPNKDYRVQLPVNEKIDKNKITLKSLNNNLKTSFN